MKFRSIQSIKRDLSNASQITLVFDLDMQER